MKKQNLRQAFFGAFILLTSAMAVSAQTVTEGIQSSGPQLPGDGGTDSNYVFFGAFRPNALTDFTLTANGFAAVNGGTLLSPDGTTVGVTYQSLGQSFFNTDATDIADFTVGATAGSNYTLSALFGVPFGGGTRRLRRVTRLMDPSQSRCSMRMAIRCRVRMRL
jgi:hypothetical protein